MSSKSEKLKRVDEEIAKLESQLYVGGVWSSVSDKVKRFQNDSLQPALNILASRENNKIKSSHPKQYDYTDNDLAAKVRKFSDYSTNETKPDAIFSFTLFLQVPDESKVLQSKEKDVLAYFYARTNKSSLCSFVDTSKPINFKQAFDTADYISKNANVFALAIEWYTRNFVQYLDKTNSGQWQSNGSRPTSNAS